MSQIAKQQAFDLLGAQPSDDAATIRKAWRAMVRTYHPDSFAGDKAVANAKLAELNAAFDTLRDHRPVRDLAAEAARRAATLRASRKAPSASAAARAREARRTADAAALRLAEVTARAEAARRSRAAEPHQSLSGIEIAHAAFDRVRKLFQEAFAGRADAIRGLYAQFC